MAVIEIDGVQFGICRDTTGVSLIDDSPGMPGLLLVVKKLLTDGRGAAPVRAGEWIVWPQYATGRPATHEPPEVFASGFMNWLRLTGRRPDPRSAYLCSAPFDRDDLLVPASTLVALVDRMEQLSGAALDEDTPARRAPPAEVVEWERLRAQSRVRADEYATKLARASCDARSV